MRGGCEVHKAQWRQHTGCRETGCLQICLVSSCSIKINLGQPSKTYRFHLRPWTLSSLGELAIWQWWGGELCQLLADDSDTVNSTPCVCQGCHHSHGTSLGSCAHRVQVVSLKMLGVAVIGVHCPGVVLMCAGSGLSRLAWG